MTDISNMDDMIDSRDIIARIEELEALTQDVELYLRDEREELATLLSFMSDMRGRGGDEQWRGDWYPVTIIRDSYFTEAMQELCEDIGDFPNGVPTYYVIDWEATASNLRADYTSAEFDGITYWFR